MYQKPFALGVVLLFLSLIPVSSSYETIDENGTLSGYVTDSAMNPIEGAIVRVSFHDTYEENYSDFSGYYHVTNIPICYCLKNATASKDGYTTERVLLAIGENTTYDFVLTPLGKTLYVGGSGPGNYTTIQSAIDAASNGDTIFVYREIYYENILIDKNISLIGEDRETTIINGNSNGSAVLIENDNVIIEEFTITNASSDDIFIAINWGGIKVKNSKNVIIQDNIIRDNSNGIYGLRVTNLTVKNNDFFNDGITLSPYDEGERPEILLDYFLHEIKDNTVNGKPLLYLRDEKELTIESDLGQLIIVNCSNIFINNISLSQTDNAILMAFCSNCVIENSKINDSGGIWALKSDFNTFQFNNISNSYIHGITLDYKSSYNLINKNIISNNDNAGVMLEHYSNSNIISCNNIIKNKFNAYLIQSFENKWNNNYWDDWVGLNNKMFFSFLPKIILGVLIEKTRFPFFNIDWHPAKEPYDIPEVV